MKPEWDAEIEASAAKHKLDPALVRRLIEAESAWNPFAVSKRGAQGLMQLMPPTAREVGVTDAFDPIQNIRGGVAYLAQMRDQAGGDIPTALAGYNAGMGRVRSAAGEFAKLPAETQAYVTKIMGGPPMANSTDPFDGVDFSKYAAGGGVPAQPPAPVQPPAPTPGEAFASAAMTQPGQPPVPAALIQNEGDIQQALAALRAIQSAQQGGYGPIADLMRAGRGFGSHVANAVNNARALVNDWTGDPQTAARVRAENQKARAAEAGAPENQAPVAPVPALQGVANATRPFNVGGFAADTAATMAPGGVAAAGLKGVAAAVPSAARWAAPAADMMMSMGMRPGFQPASLAGKAATLAGRSAVGAGTGYVGSELVEPGTGPLGALVGGVAPGAADAVGAAGSWLGNLVGSRTEAGRQTAADALVRRATTNPQQALTNIQANVPGRIAAPMGFQAANDPGLSALMASARASDNIGVSAPLSAALEGQNADRWNAITSLGANQQAIDAAANVRRQLVDRFKASNPTAMSQPVSSLGPKQTYQRFLAAPGAGQDKSIVGPVTDAMNMLRERPLASGDAMGGLLKQPRLGTVWGARQNIDATRSGLSSNLSWGEQMKGAAVRADEPLAKLRSAMTRAMHKASPEFAAFDAQYAAAKGVENANRSAFKALQSITGTEYSRDAANRVPMILPSKMENFMKSVKSKDWANLTAAQRDTFIQLNKELVNDAAALRGTPQGFSATAALLQQQLSGAQMPAYLRSLIDAKTGGVASLTGVLQKLLYGDARQNVVNRAATTLMGDPQALARVLGGTTPAPSLTPALQELLLKGRAAAPGLLNSPYPAMSGSPE